MSIKLKPRLITKLMPTMRLVEGVEYPFLYDMHSDSLFLNKGSTYKDYSSVRGLCESTMHSSRLNNFKLDLSTVDYRTSIQQVEMNLAVFLLTYYMGGYRNNRLSVFRYINEVIGSWSTHYTMKTNKKITVDWGKVMAIATFFVPNKDIDKFYKKIKSPKKILVKKHLK